MANSRWKLYALISRNIGKSLSDILIVDNVLIPNFRISFDNIFIVQIAKNRIQIFETETSSAILYYSRNSFYYRTSTFLWEYFEIDSILNDEIEDKV